MKWSEEVVWITGASSGIGLALAKELNRAGATVVRTARNEEELQKTRAEMSDPSRDICISGDVTDSDRLRWIVLQIVSRVEKLTLVISNAGIYTPTDPTPFPLNESRRMMEVNFFGFLNTLDAVLPIFQEQKSGRFVGVSSIVGLRAVPRAAAYGASKAAVTYFLESIRFQLEPQNIRLQVVHPGFVKTPLTDKNEFHMPFRISAETAAIKIRRGIEENKSEIHFPWQLTLASKFLSILPGWLYRYLMSKGVKV